MSRLPPLVLVVLVAAGCRDNKVQKVAPTLSLEALSVAFGPVRVDTRAQQVLLVSAANGADVQLKSVTIEGDPALHLDAVPPSVVAGLTAEPVTLHFEPTREGDVTATLVISSDDERQPEIRVPVTGRGAYPRFALELSCEPGARCEATVAHAPPRIDFAPEPFVRLRPIEPSTLPALRLRSTGEVPLVVTGLALEGADRAAFGFVGNAALPDGGLVLAPNAEASVPVQFRPLSDQQQQYAGAVVLSTDDPQALTTRVPLVGRLRPNLPPRVCANVARVRPVGAVERDYDTPSAWAEITRADGGVDLSATRDVPPRAEVVLSALSSTDETSCSSDPEDGRLGLTWSWRLTAQPAGSTPVTLNAANTPRATLRPAATGRYLAELSVTDSQGNVGSTTLTFEVAVKNDLAAQLDWSGDAGAGVDLDLHLVRPGASPFAPFTQLAGTAVSGDLNGYSATSRPADGGTFDWGFVGPFDDPRLNFDDTGTGGGLIENISLNGPENDDACATSACTYRLYVHGFKDGRSAAGAAPCFVDGGVDCRDGEACGCAAGTACVALNAPQGAAPSGAGKCLATVAPVVRVFLRGSATAVLSQPLTLGAPCQLLHAADITWPARGSDAGIVVSAGTLATARYGVRANGGLQCAPDAPQAGVPWYASQPR